MLPAHRDEDNTVNSRFRAAHVWALCSCPSAQRAFRSPDARLPRCAPTSRRTCSSSGVRCLSRSRIDTPDGPDTTKGAAIDRRGRRGRDTLIPYRTPVRPQHHEVQDTRPGYVTKPGSSRAHSSTLSQQQFATPGKAQMRRSSVFPYVIGLVLLLLFSVPWWTVVASASWPTPVVVVGTVVFAAGMVAFPVFMMQGHGRRHRDWAARVGDTTLGVIWVLFTWSILGQVVRLVLALSGVDGATRARITALAVVAVAIVLVGWGAVEAMRLPRTKTVDIVLPRLGHG